MLAKTLTAYWAGQTCREFIAVGGQIARLYGSEHVSGA